MGSINSRPLKAFVRFDGSGRIVAGSLILRKNKPKVGKWKEIQAYVCCFLTTTTTTTVAPTTSTTTTPQTPQPINVVATRASGGMVSGEGTSTSDSILARVSNGEYVMNARSTSAFLPLLESMNNAGNQPQFATGGLYSSQSNSNMTLGDAITKSLTDRPIKTYVVANNMSNQQQLDRVIKSRSLI